MTQDQVDLYLMTHQKYLPPEGTVSLRKTLEDADESKFAILAAAELKDPTVMLILSFVLGYWGVDRFLAKNVGMGLLKLLLNLFGQILLQVALVFYVTLPEIQGSRPEGSFVLLAFAILVFAAGKVLMIYDWVTVWKRTKSQNFLRLTEILR